ncbi:MAG: DNA polymerase Y family protein [Planctomycetota bacterium]|nr:DNA polymerase Y family protein [Planctomycetota bacterium]
MTTRVLCVKFPDWPVQRVLAERETDVPPPIVLYRASPQGGLKVSACSDTATALGVFTGMTLAEANALVNSQRPASSRTMRAEKECDSKPATPDSNDTVFVEHDPDADLRTLKALAVDCQRFSPLVGLDSDRSLAPSKSARRTWAAEHEQNSLLLDISGCAHLFGGESPLAESLMSWLASRGYNVEVGFGNTVGEAWAVAHYAAEFDNATGSPTVDLGELPIEALRISSKVAVALREFGVKRIQQLQALPRKSLPSRFGKEVLQRLDQAFGRMTEVIVPERFAAPVHAEWIFEYPTSHRETIDTVIQRLLRNVTEQLVPRCEGVLQLECRLCCSPSEAEPKPAPVVVSVGVVEPTQSAELLFEMLDLHLDAGLIRVGDRTGARITDISITTTATTSISIQQRQLFETDPARDESRELSGLLNRLSNRLGQASVLRPRLLPDAQPELAFQYTPLVGGSSVAAGTVEPTRRPPGPRPLRLMSVPERIAVETSDVGVPQRLKLGRPGWQGQVQQTAGDPITHAWGPERIETGWWRGRQIRRDYYRVEIASGEHFWIYRDRESRDWFLHGAFE